MHRVVASVAQVVDNFYMQKPGDDSTFLVAQAVPRKNVHFFSGPPVDKEKDEEIIRDFMRGSLQEDRRRRHLGQHRRARAGPQDRHEPQLHRSRHPAHGADPAASTL